MTDRSDGTNPFVGLRPFGASMHRLFFGRDAQIDEMLRRLTGTRLLVVTGPSGSGKSSLVRAGLIPALDRSTVLAGDGRWRVAWFSPGDRPLANLAAALGRPEVLDRPCEDAVRGGRGGLVEAVARAGLPAGDGLLVLVDQFEDVLKYNPTRSFDEAEVAALVDLMLEATGQRRVPIFIVVTLRADFLGNCTAYPGLTEAINDGAYMVPRMRSAQLREVIEKPVAVRQGRIAPALVERLLRDVGDSPDQLPLMQHALMRTWDYWERHHGEGEPLDEPHYEAVGAMARALSQHAEEAYAELPDDDSRRLAEALFKYLTDKVAHTRGARRPAPLSEVCAVADAAPEAVAAVVERFRGPGRWFLTPPTQVALAPDTVLDLAHESLMRVWTRLADWMDEEANSARQYLRLASTAALYQEGMAGAYQDPDLELALTWRQQCRPTVTWAQRYDPAFERAMAFLDHSRRERDFQTEHRRRQQRRQLRRARWLAVVTGTASVGALLFVLYALDLYYGAEESRKEATAQREKAEREQWYLGRQLRCQASRTLSSHAVSAARQGDPELAGVLAYQAYLLQSRNGGSLLDPVLLDALRAGLAAVDPEETTGAPADDPEVLAQRLARHVTRDLTRSEWEQYVGFDVPYEPALAETEAEAAAAPAIRK